MEVKDFFILGTEETSIDEPSINSFSTEESSMGDSTENGNTDFPEDSGSMEEISKNDVLDSETVSEVVSEESLNDSVDGETPVDESIEGELLEESVEPSVNDSDEEEFIEEFLDVMPDEELTTEQIVDTDNLFFEKNFTDYTVTEGLLLLIFVILFIRFCIDMTYKQLHWRMF